MSQIHFAADRLEQPVLSQEQPQDYLTALAHAWMLGTSTESEQQEADRLLAAADPDFLEAIALAEAGLPLLAQSLPQVEPPPELKSRLFMALEGLEPGSRPVQAPPETSGYAGIRTATDAESAPVEPGVSPPVPMDPDRDLIGLAPLIEGMMKRTPPPPIRSKAPRKALLVVDMLHDYVDEGSPMELPLARSIVPALQRRITQARLDGIPVIYINDVHEDDDPDFQVWPRHAVRGTPGAQVIPPLSPRPEEVAVARVSYSGFFETKLEEVLNALGITDLILCGQAADACVMMTGVDALMRGFHVEVPEDSVAGTTEEGKIFALRRLALLKPFGDRRR